MKQETTPKPVTIIYHSADFDGIFCREIARRHFGETADYLGWDYGQPEPIVPPETELYILDLSVPSLMNHPRLIWIDHHATAIAKYPATIPGYRIDGVAACRLAWQWFFNELAREIMSDPAYLPEKQDFIIRSVTEPTAVQWAGEYDIWDKRNPNAETFQFGLRSEPLDEYWPCLLSIGNKGEHHRGIHVLTRLLDRGEILQRYQQETDASIVQHRAFEMHWEGLHFLCLNTARCNSLTFASRVNQTHDGLLGFFWDGTKWKVSLYSTPAQFGKNIDLSAIASKYGGGGHRGACGFTVDRLPWHDGINVPDADANGKRPRLLYYDEGITAWAPVPDLVQDLCDWSNLADGENMEIEFKRKDMTDAEFEAIPEV